MCESPASMARTAGCGGAEAVVVGVAVGVSAGDGELDGDGVLVGFSGRLGSAVAVGAGNDATGEGVAGGDTATQPPTSMTTSATAAGMEA